LIILIMLGEEYKLRSYVQISDSHCNLIQTASSLSCSTSSSLLTSIISSLSLETRVQRHRNSYSISFLFHQERSRFGDCLRAGRPRGRSSSPSKVKNLIFSTSSRPWG
jgi:hypothetical protein